MSLRVCEFLQKQRPPRLKMNACVGDFRMVGGWGVPRAQSRDQAFQQLLILGPDGLAAPGSTPNTVKLSHKVERSTFSNPSSDPDLDLPTLT
jgi:hypothetical protein